MITAKFFNRLFLTKGLNPRKYNLVRRRDELIDALNKFLPKYGITNALRVRAFLANCGIETDYFKTTIEYADGWDYDISVNPKKARGLGNTAKGDGPRYKGSGLTQTTGKFNFIEVDKVIGPQLGIDLVEHPEILRENIEVAVESACIFWDKNKLNRLADRGEFKQLSAIVNRGDKNKTPLHWEKRADLYDVLTVVIADDFRIALAAVVEPAVQKPTATIEPPVVLTPSEPTAVSPTVPAAPTAQPAKEDSFLNAALNQNVSGDQMKAALPSLGARIWRYIARPLALLYAALEAGNIAAWLGVVVAALIVIYLVYAHRAELKQLWETLKNKFTS